jgi:hypothetical protein
MTPEVQAMNELVRYLCQALAFFLYLFESDAHAILSTVPSNVHGRLCNITLKDLMTTNDGNALVHTLSSLLVDYEFKKNQNIAFLLDSIEQHCGHFCGIMDITIAKWINEIKGSKSKENLNQIFSTIIKVAARIPPPGLDGINAAFVQYGYPEYAVELTLASINTHPTTTHYNIYANLLLSLPAPLIGTALYVQNKDLHYVVYAKFIERGRGSDLIKVYIYIYIYIYIFIYL